MQKSNKLISLYFTVLFLLLSIGVYAQQRTVTGTVTDSKGETLIGVSIIAKGATIGTITDLDGKYTISIPANSNAIIARYIGMKEKEVPVTGAVVDIVMAEDHSQLDEVVVIGYGAVKKRDLTGSVVSVQGETLAKVPVTSAAEAMTGRLAGVQITTADGSPDAEMVIRVRGGGSVTGDNSPLYIVDGFPVSNINDIAMIDIQSIDVLKDASSTAIYGSQGANGVVIITTKSAKGGKTTVSYNGYLQSKKLARSIDVLDTYEYAMFNYELAAFDGEDGIRNLERRLGVFDDFDLYKGVKAIDWQDDMFGSDVLSYQHNLSISGGSDKTRFGLSATWNKNGGLMANNDYERFNVNFKLNHEISKTLSLTANARIIDTEINGDGTSGGTYKIRTTEAVTGPATKGVEGDKIVDLNSLTDEEREEYLTSRLSLAERSQWYWKRKNERTFNFTGSLDWRVLKGLVYRLEAGYEYRFNEQKKWWDHRTSTASYVGGLPLADWTKENKNTFRMSNTVTWMHTFNNDHNLNVMVGQELVSKTADRNYMYGTRFSKDLSPEKVFANMAQAGGGLNITSSVDADDNLASFLGRLMYNYKERYLFNFVFRTDGSSKFAKGNYWGYFPAGAFAWRIVEEPFMEGTKDLISNLKLRLSYGEAGNNRIPSGLTRPQFKLGSTKTYGLGDVQNNYYEPASALLPNPFLIWETTITRNFGLDFGLWNERLNGAVEVYWNTAKDLLIERDIVAPGYSKTMENTAKTSNKGVELTLNGILVDKKDFYLTANFNIGFNKSNVDALAHGLQYQEYQSGWAGTDLKGVNDYRVMIDQPVGLIYGWVTDGYYTTNDFESYDAATKTYVRKEGVPNTGLLGGKSGIRPGTIKLKDLDGNGVVDDEDRTIIGNTNPDFTGGFGVNGVWKGFDFTVLFNFVYGNDVYNANKIASSQQYRTGNYQSNLLDIMRGDNRYTYLDRNTGTLVTDLATLAQMNEGANAKEYWSPISFGNASVLPHSWAIEDGSFLRLQNITLGYTLPKSITRKFLCEQLRLYCTLNNVWIWTDYTGYDPEVYSPVRGSSTSGLTPGVDYSSYPKSFSYTFGLNVTF